MNMHPKTQPRHLVLILGDQLNVDATAFDGFDPKQDAVWMAEVTGEATHVWSHKARIAIFLTAMRHFRDELRHRGVTVHYRELVDATLGAGLSESLRQLNPQRVVVVEPGGPTLTTPAGTSPCTSVCICGTPTSLPRLYRSIGAQRFAARLAVRPQFWQINCAS